MRFLVNSTTFLKTLFFNKTPLLAAFENDSNFIFHSSNHQKQNFFIFLNNRSFLMAAVEM